MTHHADALAFICAGESQHATHLVEAHSIVKIALGHEFHTQRVARHNHCLGDFAVLGPNVGCRSLCHIISDLNE